MDYKIDDGQKRNAQKSFKQNILDFGINPVFPDCNMPENVRAKKVPQGD